MTKFGRRSLFSILLLLGSFESAYAESSTSGLLVEEVIAQSDDPKGYDWRRRSLQVEASYALVNEANVFQSRSYGLGVATSFGGAWILRGAARRAETSETPNSRQMALSIYSQAAQPSRYEFLAGVGYTLLDGRSATALSPRITDIGHSLTALLGAHYNLFDNQEPAPLRGMRAIRYDVVAEAGLRFEVFLPKLLVLGIEWTYSIPLASADPDLPEWQRFGATLGWAFGE